MDATVTNQIIQALVALLLTLAVPLLGKGIQWIFLKFKIDNQALAETAARSAIAYAEELAAQKLKNGVVIPGAEKLQTAIEGILAKLPGITVAEAEVLVHQELPKVGLGASTFLRAVANAAKQ